MKKLICTAPNTKLFKTHASVAVVNKATFYDTSTNAGKESKEVPQPLPFTRRSPASSATSK